MPTADQELPGWALEAEDGAPTPVRSTWPNPVTREWAWGGSKGRGVRVCVVDSGIDADHPLVGRVERSDFVSRGDGRQERIVEKNEDCYSSNDIYSDYLIR